MSSFLVFYHYNRTINFYYFVCSTDGSVILRMEETVLNKLNFDLYIPVGKRIWYIWFCLIYHYYFWYTQQPTVIDFVSFFIECLTDVADDSIVAVYSRVRTQDLYNFPFRPLFYFSSRSTFLSWVWCILALLNILIQCWQLPWYHIRWYAAISLLGYVSF